MRRFASILIAAAVASALLGACGDDTDDARSGASTTTPAPAYAAELKGNLEKIMQDLQVPSATVLVRSESKGDWSAALGTRRVGGTDPVTMDDHYRIGSVTKIMTGTVVLQLVQEGKLSLDDPVSKYLPDVPGGQSITIGHLLEMRSGLFDYTADEGVATQLATDRTKVWQPSEFLAASFSHPLSFPAGTRYEYVNANYVALGAIVEKVTGRPVEDELKQRIFDRLELRDTVYPAADDPRIPPPHPQGYMFGTLLDPAGPLNDVTDWYPLGGADGRVISDAGDMARFIEADVDLDGGLLSPEMQRTRLASVKPAEATDPGYGYGLGISKYGPLYGHTGTAIGFKSIVLRDPDARNTIVVLTSLNFGPNGESHNLEMAKAISTVLYGQPIPDPPEGGDPTDDAASPDVPD